VEATDQKPNARDEFLDKTMAKLSNEFSDVISLIGIIDEKAKEMYSQKGHVSFPLNAGRQHVLGVQLSLSFSMLKQIENLLGTLSHIVLSYDKHEVVLTEIVSNSIIYVICKKGHANQILDALAKLLVESPSSENSKQDNFHEDDWSGS